MPKSVGVIQEDATRGAAVDERALPGNDRSGVGVAAGRHLHRGQGRGDHGE